VNIIPPTVHAFKTVNDTEAAVIECLVDCQSLDVCESWTLDVLNLMCQLKLNSEGKVVSNDTISGTRTCRGCGRNTTLTFDVEPLWGSTFVITDICSSNIVVQTSGWFAEQNPFVVNEYTNITYECETDIDIGIYDRYCRPIETPSNGIINLTISWTLAASLKFVQFSEDDQYFAAPSGPEDLVRECGIADCGETCIANGVTIALVSYLLRFR